MKDFEKILRMTQPELKLFLNGYLTGRGYDVISEDGFLYAKGSLPVLLVAHMDRFPDGDTIAPERYTKRGNIEIYETKDGKTIKLLPESIGAPDIQGETIEDFYNKHYPQKLYDKRGNIANKLESTKAKVSEKTAEGKTVWISPQGICTDDRAGIWTIMKLIQKYHPSVLFTEDEEVMCEEDHGSVKFCNTNYIKNLGVDYMIQIDRCNDNDLKFYKCGNSDFQNWIEQKTGYRPVCGEQAKKGKTDITRLMPKSKIAGVNISCGYYNEHYPEEFVVLEEMVRTKDTIDKLLKVNVDEVFPVGM